MTACPMCSTVLPSDHPALTLAALESWVRGKGGWDIFDTDSETYGYPVGKQFAVGDRRARVEAKKTQYNVGDLTEYSDRYGSELPQGTTFTTFVVVGIDGNYFKKTGTGDSYGEISWDGDLRIVTPVEKVVKSFE